MAATAENAPGNWGLIAGNGDFPFLVLEGARSRGIEMAVIAIREEASPALERAAKRLHWISLGELSRGIELLHQEGVKHAVMAGQVKHNKIFSSIRPDWRLAKLLFSLPTKNTDSLIGAVARVLEDEGIELVDSTKFLGPLLPAEGVLTAARAQTRTETADIAYGREVAQQIAALDLGQTVVIRDRACVAVEAMEGTDETIERAARIAGGQQPGCGQGEQAAAGYAFRRAGGRRQNNRSDAAGKRYRAGDRCAPHAAFRPRRARSVPPMRPASPFRPSRRTARTSSTRIGAEKEIMTEKTIRVAVVGRR